MDVVIPLGKGSKHDNIELRFALRSIEKNLPHDRIIIVGEKPAWIRNIEHLPAKDTNICRAANIKDKIYKGSRIASDNFIISNDDIFILKPVTELPNYYQSTLGEISELNGGGVYMKIVRHTMRATGPETKFFDVHTPMVLNRLLLHDFVTTTDWRGNPSHIFKSYYAHYANLHGTSFVDLKIFHPRTLPELIELCKERTFVSIDDMAFKGKIVDYLKLMFPDKSKYER